VLSYIKPMGDAKKNFFVVAEIEFAWLVTEFGFKEVNRTTGETFASIAWATQKTYRRSCIGITASIFRRAVRSPDWRKATQSIRW
jgi:hypothetical protein